MRVKLLPQFRELQSEANRKIVMDLGLLMGAKKGGLIGIAACRDMERIWESTGLDWHYMIETETKSSTWTRTKVKISMALLEYLMYAPPSMDAKRLLHHMGAAPAITYMLPNIYG